MDQTPLSQYWSFRCGALVSPQWVKSDPLQAIRWMFNRHGLAMAKELWLRWSQANPVPEVGFSSHTNKLLEQHRLTREFIEAAEVEATRLGPPGS